VRPRAPGPKFLFGGADPSAVVAERRRPVAAGRPAVPVDYSFTTRSPTSGLLAECLPPNGCDTMWATRCCVLLERAVTPADACFPRRTEVRATMPADKFLVGDAAAPWVDSRSEKPREHFQGTAIRSCARSPVELDSRCCS